MVNLISGPGARPTRIDNEMIVNIKRYNSWVLFLLLQMPLLSACNNPDSEPGVYNGKVDKHAQDQATREKILQKRFSQVQMDR